LLLLLFAAGIGFAQSEAKFSGFPETLAFSPTFELFRPHPAALEQDVKQNQSIFANASQGVKDLRRGEIVFFGSFPFTVFFTRTFMDLFRAAAHNWDTRYAPWPFKSAGAVSMTNNELALMFTVAVSASLVISIVDYLLVRNKRKAALPEYNY